MTTNKQAEAGRVVAECWTCSYCGPDCYTHREPYVGSNKCTDRRPMSFAGDRAGSMRAAYHKAHGHDVREKRHAAEDHRWTCETCGSDGRPWGDKTVNDPASHHAAGHDVREVKRDEAR